MYVPILVPPTHPQHHPQKSCRLPKPLSCHSHPHIHCCDSGARYVMPLKWFPAASPYLFFIPVTMNSLLLWKTCLLPSAFVPTATSVQNPPGPHRPLCSSSKTKLSLGSQIMFIPNYSNYLFTLVPPKECVLETVFYVENIVLQRDWLGLYFGFLLLLLKVKYYYVNKGRWYMISGE